MPRLFNRVGPSEPAKHYLVPPDARLPAARSLVERGAYFEVYGQRFTGKTTALLSLAHDLTSEGRYVAVLVSMDTGTGDPLAVDLAEPLILRLWREMAQLQLPSELQPPPFPEAPAGSRIGAALSAWAQSSPRPLVVFLDDVEELHDELLLSVLRQIRSGFAARPRAFPHSLALSGKRRVRDAKIPSTGADSLETASSFNLETESLQLGDFNRNDVAALFAQHTEDTGQPILPEAVDRALELADGQPLIINVLAMQLINAAAPDRSRPITSADVDAAMELPLWG
jgi:hypothetical protein